MRTSSKEQRDDHHGSNKINKETRIICPSNTASTTSQRLQMQALKRLKCYHAKVRLDKDAKSERFWWNENLRRYNGKSPTDLCISTDVSTNGWGTLCQRISTGGLWSQEENKAHINILDFTMENLQATCGYQRMRQSIGGGPYARGYQQVGALTTRNF